MYLRVKQLIWIILGLISVISVFKLSWICLIGVILAYVLIKRYEKKRIIIKSGLIGEKYTKEIFKRLPNSYTVIPDLTVSSRGKSSQLDHVVIGPNGIFIIETKNLNGRIEGHYDNQEVTQNKIGRGGEKYTRNFYNPIKQVTTHVYRLKDYLKSNNLSVWVNGCVYFSHHDAEVFLNSRDIPVFSYQKNGPNNLVNYILRYKSNQKITSSVHKKIVKLLKS